MVMIQSARCPRCGYEWQPRTPYPKQCPEANCGQRWPLGRPPAVAPQPASVDDALTGAAGGASVKEATDGDSAV